MYHCTSVEGGARVHDEDASLAVCVSPTLTEGSEHASFAYEAKFGNVLNAKKETHTRNSSLL